MHWQAMIDDSADRDREKVVISAALFGEKDAWNKLRSAWRRRLDRDNIAYFKSSQCRHLRGQFFKFRDLKQFPKPLGRECADRIQTDLDQIIHSSELFGVGAIIPVPLWRKFNTDPRYSTFSADPYHWAVQTVWMQCVSAMKEMGRGNVISLAHDDGNNFPALHRLYESYKSKNRDATKLFVDFIPINDETSPPIQAADVAASVTHRYAMEWLEDPTSARLSLLKRSMYRISIWDERFATLVLENEAKKRRNQVY